jgi:pimeloyl-ACP methyl ester carboxylesterase
MGPKHSKNYTYKVHDRINRNNSELLEELKQMEESGENLKNLKKYIKLFWKAQMYTRIKDPSILDDYDFPYDYENELPNNLLPYLQYYFKSLGEYDWISELSTISASILTIHGELDTIPVKSSQDWVDNIPKAKLVVMDNVGHFAPMEDPEAFFEIVNAFLHN